MAVHIISQVADWPEQPKSKTMKTIIFIKHMNLTVVSVGKSVSFSGLTNRLLWRSFERQQWAPVRHQHQHQHQTSTSNIKHQTSNIKHQQQHQHWFHWIGQLPLGIESGWKCCNHGAHTGRKDWGWFSWIDFYTIWTIGSYGVHMHRCYILYRCYILQKGEIAQFGLTPYPYPNPGSLVDFLCA